MQFCIMSIIFFAGSMAAILNRLADRDADFGFFGAGIFHSHGFHRTFNDWTAVQANCSGSQHDATIWGYGKTHPKFGATVDQILDQL